MLLQHCDISRAGGFTEITQISVMCELAGALLIAYIYASAISDFYNIHMQTASRQITMIEFLTKARTRTQPGPRPPIPDHVMTEPGKV